LWFIPHGSEENAALSFIYCGYSERVKHAATCQGASLGLWVAGRRTVPTHNTTDHSRLDKALPGILLFLSFQ